MIGLKQSGKPTERAILGDISNQQVADTSKRKITVAVEGNIGSGKTTFLSYFKDICKQKVELKGRLFLKIYRRSDWLGYRASHSSGKFSNIVFSWPANGHLSRSGKVVPEPVQAWKNLEGHNTLDLMYRDATRWSLAFQSYVQLTMCNVHLQATEESTVKLMERSIFSAKYCFVENLHRSGVMPDIDSAVLSEWYNWILENVDVHLDLIVYLRAKPDVCLERIKSRNRSEEKAVPIEYLESLHTLHEDWLIKQIQFPLPAPVLVIEADCDLESLKKKIVMYESHILQGTTSVVKKSVSLNASKKTPEIVFV